MAKPSPKKNQKKEKVEKRLGEGFLRRLFRTILTTVLVIVIFYVTILLFTRTDGFRSYLEGRLENELGLSLNIGTSRMDWTGHLTLGDISPARTNELGRGRLHVDRAVVHTDLLGTWRHDPTSSSLALTMDKWSLTFSQTEEGAWEPTPLNGMNKWLNRWCKIDVAEPDEPHPGAREEEASRETKTTNLVSIDRLKLVLTDGAIAWEDAQGEVRRSAYDVEAYLTPLDLPTRKATHIHVRASTVDLSAWSKIRDLDVELLRTGDSYRVLRLNAERQSVSRPVSEVDPLQNIAPVQDVIDRVNPVPPELVLQEDSLPAPVPSDESEEEGLQRFIREELSNALRP